MQVTCWYNRADGLDGATMAIAMDVGMMIS